jgi:predicted dithiol-disulfide oxidoreductase (DUF899 family)
MNPTSVATKEEWLEDRRALLEEEKALTRARDALAEKRRALPWVRVDEDYTFESEAGTETLADLFGIRTQLIVQHFMFAPDWQDGCKSCSFWADQFDPAVPHLSARDVAFAVVSQAPHSVFAPFKARMGWKFHWVSSAPCNFSNDYHVWYTPEDIAAGNTCYNFTEGLHYGEHAPGVSVFAKDDDGAVYHTYSCYARGLDILNGAYHLLDLTPKGRDEADLPMPMAWLKHHDRYES